MRKQLFLAVSAVALGACSADLPTFVTGDPDGGMPDAITCEPSTEVCDDDTGVYVACDANGEADVVMSCALGCDDNVEKCIDVDPSNDLADFLDDAADGGDLVVAGFDTSAGACFSSDGSNLGCLSSIKGDIAVFMFDSVTIECSGDPDCVVSVVGTKPLAIVANGDVTILSVLDISASGTAPGSGALDLQDGSPELPTEAATNAGQGGGGHDLQGANGGASGDGDGGGGSGNGLAYTRIEPLAGGMRGGGIEAGDYRGGGGGGAVQLVSRTRILITGNGQIDASGGGGAVRGAGIGGGGGGSGGAILLEAPIVQLDGGAVVLSTKGGGGGSGGAGMAGTDGGTGANAAAGGVGAGAEGTGGDGGTVEDDAHTDPTAGGGGGEAGSSGGGGGGSVGRVQLNTAVEGEVLLLNGANIRSATYFGALSTRLIP